MYKHMTISITCCSWRAWLTRDVPSLYSQYKTWFASLFCLRLNDSIRTLCLLLKFTSWPKVYGHPTTMLVNTISICNIRLTSLDKAPVLGSDRDPVHSDHIFMDLDLFTGSLMLVLYILRSVVHIVYLFPALGDRTSPSPTLLEYEKKKAKKSSFMPRWALIEYWSAVSVLDQILLYYWIF